MTRWRQDGAPVTAAIEIERLASFDQATRRFGACAIRQQLWSTAGARTLAGDRVRLRYFLRGSSLGSM